MIEPYFKTRLCTLYQGDARSVLPQLGEYNFCITEPPRWEYDFFHSWYDIVRKKCGTLAVITQPAGLKYSVRLIGDELRDVVAGRNLTKERPGGIGKTNWIAAVIVGTSVKEGLNSFDFEQLEELPNHPEPKPVEYMTRLIQRLLETGSILPTETLIDPFAGSGTTLLAATRLHLNCVGIESSEEYCKLTAERVRKG